MTAVQEQPESPSVADDRRSPPRHGQTVAAALEGEWESLEAELVSPSWRRSSRVHHIDPDSREPPHILSDSALRHSVEPIGNVVLAAQAELDRLHKIVGEAGYVTLFCDTNGVAIEHRGRSERSAEFRYWGTWLGGVWSEATEGTNGIGTCIAECRPVTVHQAQHFRTRHIGLSCSGAPVFDADARLVAVLDVSAIDPQLSAHAHALTLPLVVSSARLIEERLFRERFPKEWIMAIAPQADQPAALLAVDRDHRVIGADRCARSRFALEPHALAAGIGVWTLFQRGRGYFQPGVRPDYPIRVTSARGGETLFALVSTPLTSARSLDSTLLTQPRIAVLDELQRHFAVEAPRGGLAPGKLRRVREYIETHLGEPLAIETLASQAGLSVHHFARAFRESVGVPPHRYLLEQRLRRAAELLKSTEQPLANIALSVGFSDQSHFSRSFHWLEGQTPGQFRRAHR
jgi:transcriptional regulator of acetoin/glycerol metabolism/AraC-like DNA-binding protein